MRIRIKFTKSGAMRFIGHLDMMRYFQKAIRRAGIDIAYSTGYSPHQIMSFAAPLGVGVTSEGEYMDIEVNSTLSTDASLAALNSVMAEGVTVTEYVALRDGAKKAMTAVAAADYMVYYKRRSDCALTQQEISSAVTDFLGKEEIIVTKQTKKSERTLDLKPLIYELKPYFDDDKTGFFMKLSAGSADNVKPELVLETLYAGMGLNYDAIKMQIHRIEIYERTKDKLRTLSAAGDIIR